MKNIFRNILIILTGSVMMFGAAGCVSLDKVPSNSYSDENVWKSGVLAQAAVNGVYNALYYKYCTPSAWEARAVCTDTYGSVMDIDANWVGAGMVGTGSLTPSNGNNYTIFKWLYSIVYRANKVIDNIASVPETELSAANKDLGLNEAKFMRAWAYYQMSFYWGGVPIYTKSVDPTEATLGRSTLDQVLAQVIDDLNSVIASANIPNLAASGERASKAAAYAYRGYVYQRLGKFAEALADFKAIEGCGAKLYSPNDGAAGNQDYKDLLTMQHENEPENIFAVACIGKSDMGNPRARNYSTRIHGGSGWGNYLPNPAYVERFENADGTKFNWEDYLPGYTSMTPYQRSVYFLRDGLNGGEKIEGKTWEKDGLWYLDANYKWLASDKKKNMTDFGSDFTKYINNGNEARIKYVYDNRDPRLQMKMITPYSDFYGYTSATGSRNFTLRWPYCLDTGSPFDIRTDTNSMFYYLWRTYTHESNEWTDMWFSPNNIRFIRYAEILLHMAECQVELGQYAAAVENVNKVRKRAGMVQIGDPAYKGIYSVASGKKLMDLVRNEMFVELGGEDSMWYNECRWTDRDKQGTVEWEKYSWAEWKFKRHDCNAIGDWNSNGLMEIWGVIKYKHVAVDYFKNIGYFWPFPLTEIQMNPNCEQTPGWVN